MRSGAVLLFFITVAVVFTAPVSLSPHSLAVNEADPLHIAWILAWDAHQLVRDPIHLFDSNAFYPYDDSLAFSEHLLGPALLAAPVFYLSGNALLAQNVVMVLSLALSAWTMFLLLRQVVGRNDAAVIAGMVYAFHTYAFHETPRLQLLSVQWWPLAVLYLQRALEQGGRKNALLFGVFFTLQGLSCTYYLFYFALALGIWLPGYALVARSPRRLLAVLPPLALAGIVFGVLSIPYFGALQKFSFERGLAEGVNLLEYVRPPAGSLLASLYRPNFDPSVVPHYLGFVSIGLALAGVALTRPKDRFARGFYWLSLSTLLLGLVLSLGPVVRVGRVELGAGPYGWMYEHLPFFRVLRNAERSRVLVQFGVAALAGLGATALMQRWPRRALAPARVLLLVLLPYEHFTGGQTFTRIPAGARTPEVYGWLAENGGAGPVVDLPPYPRRELSRHALYMLQSTVHFEPIVFGRTSFYPPLVGFLAWELRDFPETDGLALLEGLGVGRIVVHPNQWNAADRGAKLARLRGLTGRLAQEGRFPALEGPGYKEYGYGDERVYRLRWAGRAPSTADLCQPGGEIEPDGWRLGGENPDALALAIDRDPTTKWRSEKQIPSLKLDVDLGREETVSAIQLAVGYPYDEFPRDLTLKVRSENGRFERVDYRWDLAAKWELTEALVLEPSRAALTLRFEPVRARRLRFWVREGKSFDYALPPWTLPELHVYRTCHAAGFAPNALLSSSGTIKK